MIRDYYGIAAGDIDQPAFPLFALFSTALGACAVIPDMDPSKPAKVDPRKFVASIEQYGVTYSFGSPAIWNVVSSYCLEREHRAEVPEKGADGRGAGAGRTAGTGQGHPSCRRGHPYPVRGDGEPAHRLHGGLGDPGRDLAVEQTGQGHLCRQGAAGY